MSDKTPVLLTLNAGSSSVKFQVFGATPALPRLAEGGVSGIGSHPVLSAARDAIDKSTDDEIHMPLPDGSSDEDAMRAIIGWIHGHDAGWDVTAVAHRFVHGGTEFIAPVRVRSDIFHRLKALIPLAPLHQPHNLAALGLAVRALPHVPQIACFDTAFHAQHTPLFNHFALPESLFEQGIRRYGFHGLSYGWIAHVLATDYPALAKGRVIVAHLGNGASLCAMKNNQSIDTTMGMTALDGLPMGTRCGTIDAGAVIHMLRTQQGHVDAVEHLLYEQSGLKGLSDISNDVKTLIDSTDPRAAFALDYFALHVAKHIGAMSVAIGGAEALVFTGGIGEHAASVRTAIAEHVGFLNIPQTLVIPANEERMMAMQTLTVITPNL